MTLRINEKIFTIVLAHDIADDMFEAGMSSVTMVQRSSTCKCAVWNLSPDITIR
jgi:hypothetical protein